MCCKSLVHLLDPSDIKLSLAHIENDFNVFKFYNWDLLILCAYSLVELINTQIHYRIVLKDLLRFFNGVYIKMVYRNGTEQQLP